MGSLTYIKVGKKTKELDAKTQLKTNVGCPLFNGPYNGPYGLNGYNVDEQKMFTLLSGGVQKDIGSKSSQMHAAKKKVLPDLLERKCDQTKLPFVGQNGHFKVKVEGLYCNDIISFLN